MGDRDSDQLFLIPLPALLKRDNKIVAVIHYVGFRIINGNGEIVKEISIQSEAASCK